MLQPLIWRCSRQMSLEPREAVLRILKYYVRGHQRTCRPAPPPGVRDAYKKVGHTINISALMMRQYNTLTTAVTVNEAHSHTCTHALMKKMLATSACVLSLQQ